MNALVFAPHPDDEVIGCGGYAAKLISDGSSVDVAYLTTPGKVRMQELQAVQTSMGFRQLYFLDQGPGRFLTKNEDLFRKVLSAIRKTKTDIALIPHENEQDKDHSFLNDVVRECAYLCEGDFLLQDGEEPTDIATILGYEVWTPIQNPALHVDVTDFIDKKKQAMGLYASQDYKDFAEMFEGLNRYRGVVSGVGRFAEAFEVYKVQE